jgi:tRNA isopentenyl-2-thiomethyl-A-37 hydroxylase MiaE
MSKAVKVAAAEIRAAKKWLERRKIKSSEISPRRFAKAAKALDKSFKETLRVIAGEQTGGQV